MNRPRIVVLGAGFGGLAFCKKLQKTAVDMTLIDRQNHHLFQPLLYQVATAGLSAPEIAQPIRAIFRKQKNLTVLMDEVEGIDLNGKTVQTTRRKIEYDYLIIGLGAVTSYFGHDEWSRHATGLKSLHDATEIRRRLLTAFEQAELGGDEKEIAKLMTIVVVGGGPTGVEVAGACAELARNVLASGFRRIDTKKTRIVLVEAASDLLTMFPGELSDYARERLTKMGVEVRTGEAVKEIADGLVQLEGEEIAAANIIWAAGVEASPVSKSLGIPLGRGGRIEVAPDLSLPGHPEVFSIGDIVSLVDANGVRVPGVAPAAMQMGNFAANAIQLDLITGGPGTRQRDAFTYWDKGNMATIGRSAAVAEVGSFTMKGLMAWFAWLFIHLVLLVGMRNRIAVFIQWIYSYVTYRRGARIITGMDANPNKGDK
jgi:NADH dehydrogenase